MGWLIDPDEKNVFVYRPKQEIEVFDAPQSIVPMPAFMDSFTLTIEQVFGWLML